MAIKTTQTKADGGSIRNVTTNLDNADLFRGMLKLDHGNMAQYDFMVGGYATAYWITMPTFMERSNLDLTTRFKNYLEKGATSFDGIQDMSANTEDVTGGIAGNSFKQMTNMRDEFDSFSMKVYEMQGSIFREAIEYWLTGIRDPKYGFARYLDFEGCEDLTYSAQNHTAEVLYVVTDPSNSSNGIEYACLITNVMPTKVPKSHLNMTHGDHPIVQFDLEFTGVKYESAYINSLAQKIHENKRMVGSYLDFTPQDTTTYESSAGVVSTAVSVGNR